MTSPQSSRLAHASRRDFLKSSSSTVVGMTLAGTLASGRGVHAAGSDVLKVGLIGCGGRGTGAAVNALRADPNVQLVALADAFPYRVQNAREQLSAQKDAAAKLAVDDDHCFSGFDAYQRLIDSDVDVVLLCETPHFRPKHLRAAVEAGKQIFCEKPVAVDAPGVRHVLESTEMARQKGLNLVSGLCWRYDHAVRETMKRLQDGAIGEILAVHENYLTGTLWHRGREASWSEMEYQMRNWYYFTWLSGDHIVEQHIHSLDKAMWLMGDKPPLHAFGLGGREVRKEDMWGNIFDHFAVCYEWANGAKTFSYTRQMKSCYNDVDDYVIGSRGRAVVLKNVIEPHEGPRWQYQGSKPLMYDVEHAELFAAIRAGRAINNGLYMAQSTLLAILGREACYTGQRITWDDMLNSQRSYSPAQYEWGDVEIPAVAVPGVSQLA